MTPAQFRAIRERLGLSQAQLADRLGVAMNSVSRWEIGEREIHPMTAKLITFLEHEHRRAKRGTKNPTKRGARR